MIKKLKNLKTSDKIIFLFSIFNFVWLIILLFTINIIYFFIWYSEQKKESWYDMNKNYTYLVWNQKINNREAFKKYILKKNTIIIPNQNKKIIYSKWVKNILKDNLKLLNKVKTSFYYIDDETIYFIFTKKYPNIGEVKVFFDTTPYVESQLIIIKISLFMIFISLFIFYFIWKKITRYSFRNLDNIAKQTKKFDIEKEFKQIKIIWNPNDEINILADTINNSFFHIKTQTSNLKQFITDVSHEFKTPLMVINSKIDLYNKKLEKGKLEKDDTQNLLYNIKDKTRKLNNLLETFLLLSRIENNIEKLNIKKVNIWKYLEKFTQDYLKHNNYIIENNILEKINIKFKINKNIFLEIEENTFNILFWNLLSNAIKFSKDNLKNNKKIEIEVWVNEKSFWIKDNWIWIDKKNTENVFNKFFRDDKNLEWFGVWLFLVKRLADLYNWKVDIESNLWEWSKFIIKYK